jgi:hypothetical protein
LTASVTGSTKETPSTIAKAGDQKDLQLFSAVYLAKTDCSSLLDLLIWR